MLVSSWKVENDGGTAVITVRLKNGNEIVKRDGSPSGAALLVAMADKLGVWIP